MKKNQPKVALLINSYNLGGAEKLMYDVAAQLTSDGAEVCLVSMKKPETKLEKEIFDDVRSRGIASYTIDKPCGGKKLKTIFDILSFIRTHKINVLHTNGQSPDFYGRLAAALCRNCKTVVTIHNTGGYSRKIEQFLDGITDTYTAVSEQAMEYAKNELGVKKDVAVICNGIDVKRYEGHTTSDNRFTILSVGRIVPQKGYLEAADGVCRYLAKNSEARWVIVGETNQNPEYFEAVKDRIWDKVRDRVIFSGAVTNPEDYYKSADCFLLPSGFEGFGIAFIEAMAARLPIIGNNVGVVPDILKMGGTVTAMNDLCKNIEEAKGVTKDQLDKNYEICCKNYSIKAISHKYFEVYKRVLNAKEG